MNGEPSFLWATPVLASLDIQRSIRFFVSKLGFSEVYVEPGGYGIVESGPVEVHFFACTDPDLPRNTSCRITVRGISCLYERCISSGIVHPSAPLTEKPWGAREFGILDPDGNLVTFTEPNESAS